MKNLPKINPAKVLKASLPYDRVVTLEFCIRDQNRCENFAFSYGSSIIGTVLVAIFNCNLSHFDFLRRLAVEETKRLLFICSFR